MFQKTILGDFTDIPGNLPDLSGPLRRLSPCEKRTRMGSQQVAWPKNIRWIAYRGLVRVIESAPLAIHVSERRIKIPERRATVVIPMRRTALKLPHSVSSRQ